VTRGASAALAVAGALWLTGCQTAPGVPTYVAQAADAHYEGRLAVRVENDPKRSFSANFALDGNGGAGQLTLSTAVGTQVALARWLPGRVWLVNSDGTHTFNSIHELSRETLGEDIPLVAFFDWLAGRPWPGGPNEPLADPRLGFRQLGWEVRLDRHAEGLLVAQRDSTPAVTLRAKLDTPPAP
jgi:outer membrane lipoprotein LolB